MASHNILLAPGDGIGPEVVGQTRRVLEAVGERFGHEFAFETALVGAAAIAAEGIEITDEVVDRARSCDAVLLGACGVAGGAAINGRHPERAVLRLRTELALWTNIRPVQIFEPIIDSSPVKPEVLRGVDMVVLRELTGGVYYAEPRGRLTVDGEPAARDTMLYRRSEVERIGHRAFQMARRRRGKVTSVDKQNVLESSAYWHEVMTEVAAQYPDVEMDQILVDAFAMRLILSPRDFDVVVTTNMFGDIITDEMAVLSASLGMMPSASLGDSSRGLYEPIHGAAPDIAGQGLANPIGAILSAAMMLRLSFDLEAEAQAIEDAVSAALDAGYRTADIKEAGSSHVGTSDMGEAIIARLGVPAAA